MARRLTLLALLACAVAVHRPPYTSDVSESESLDPFYLWDDDSNEVTPISNFRTTKTSAKVMLKLNKQPKVNVTMKNSKSDKKKEKDFSKTSSININSNTNFVFTKRPPVKKTHPVPVIHNEQHMEPEYDYDYAEENMIPVPKPTTTTRRPEATRPRRRIHSTTRRPTTTRARTTTFRKITKKPQTKKVICPTKTPIWLSNYFHDEKNKKSANKKPQKSGLISNIYNWISKTSIFGATNWFQSINYRVTTTTTTTTTTEAPVTENDWFQNLLVTEEADESSNNAPVVVKKPEKKLKRSYNGYQLIRAYSDSQWKVHELLELQEDSQGSGITWWTMPSLNGSSDILIPPDLLSDVKDTLKSAGIDFDVVIWDLQKAIKYENPQLSKKQRLELVQLRGHPMTWKRYHRYSDILRYLEYLQHSYGDIVELVPLGRSSEGLPLVVVKVSLPTNESYYEGASPKSNKKKWKLRSRLKPTVWLDGGTHAREWIAPAVATWILSAIVEGENGSGSEYDLLKQADFYIMPILNPDGYEYSHTQDRLWMKTRSRPDDQSDDFFMGWLPWNWGRKECIGVDADRNWDYHWGEKDSSRDPCADKYAGPHPFSEPETRAVSQFLAEHRGQIKVYITLHAYSQAWLLPSSYADMPFADDGMLMEMGKLATTALKDLYGTKYQIGTMEELRQPAAGMSHDWAKARAGIKFSYHVDLRDSSGPYGFLLPGSQIISTSRETWQAIKAIVDNLNPN